MGLFGRNTSFGFLRYLNEENRYPSLKGGLFSYFWSFETDESFLDNCEIELRFFRHCVTFLRKQLAPSLFRKNLARKNFLRTYRISFWVFGTMRLFRKEKNRQFFVQKLNFGYFWRCKFDKF